MFTKSTRVFLSILSFLSLFVALNSARAQAPIISTIQGLPTGNFSGRGIAYGNGAYVAVFQDANIYRSTDGENWSKVTDASVPAGDYQSISFGAGVFVITGYSGLIASSPDGIVWTVRSSSTTNHLYEVDFLNGSFYAVGQNRTIRQSSDGINWNTITVSSGTATDNLTHITYGNGIFAISARNSGHSGVFIYRSTTGASNSWTFQSVVSGSINKVQFLGNRFYIFMSNTHVYTSTDASTWTNSTASMVLTLPNATTQNIGTPNQTFNGIYDGSKWYLFGYSQYNSGYGSVFSSTDGINFTLEPPAAYVVTQGSAYVNGKYFVYGNEGLAGADDGVNYTYFGGSFYSIAKNGADEYVAVGAVSSAGVIFSSADYNTWTNRLPSFNTELYAVVYDGSRFVAAGERTILESADGTSWTTLSTPTEAVSGMIHDGSKFVAGWFNPSTYAGSIRYSSDGISWTSASSVDNYYMKVRQVNGQYFAVGVDNSSYLGVIMHSTNGISWSDVTPNLGFDVAFFSDVTYDGSKYHFAGVDAINYDFFSVSSSTPSNSATYGNLGFITNAPGGSSIGGYWGETVIAYSNGRFAGGVVDNNTGEANMIYSLDGVNWTAEPTGVNSYVNDIITAGNQFRLVGSNDSKFIINFSSTLPVVLTHFDAKLINGDALLNWATASEINSRDFRIQHSGDAQQWETIGTVLAAGNSEQSQSYQFTHIAPTKGLHYYRLLQNDIDGRQTYSEVRKLQVIDKSSIRLYPNPTSGPVQLQRSNSNRVLVTVLNSHGQRMYQAWHTENQITLQTQSWPAGVYKVQVDEQGSPVMMTLLKSH